MGSFHSSVDAEAAVSYPLKARPAVAVPAPLTPYLAVFKFATSVHAVPFHFSLIAEPSSVPPKAKAAVLLAPSPP